MRAVRVFLVGCVAWLALAGGAVAQERAVPRAHQQLFEVLRLDETVEVMREEAIEGAHGLSESFLGDPASDAWLDDVRRINDAERMRATLETETSRALEGQDVAAMTAFFDRPEGQRILDLELAARRVMSAPGALEAAILSYREAEAEGAGILDEIHRMTADSNLIDRNVEGALNSNLMFFRGMADGGAYDGDVTEMARDVWRQESELRDELADWLGAFQLMAYGPLERDRLTEYSAFFRTPEGRALNTALFRGFNRMLDETSYLTGRALARHAQAERL